MSTFLFASSPVLAHTSNPTPFAQRLIARGHRVLWYAGRRFHQQIANLGAIPIAYVQADDFSASVIEEHFPQLKGLEGVAAIRRAFADVFVGEAAKRVADLRQILAEHDVDAMLCDNIMYGVGLASELGGPPWATFGDGPFPYFEPDNPPFGPALAPLRGPVGRLRNRLVGAVGRRIVFADAQRRFDQTRSSLALPPSGVGVLDSSVSPYLHLHGAVPSFDYPRRRVPEHMHWVGALRPDPPTNWMPPDWWSEVSSSSRPVVLVSQGSLRPDLTELIGPTVRALDGKDCLVVVTTGSADPDQLTTAYGGGWPANVRVAASIPYDLLLPYIACFVTNGGYTGVTLALAHGVPLVQAGMTEEKAEIAARIRYAGVGITLGTTRPAPEAVGRAVADVLGTSGYRVSAQRVQAEMSEHDAGTEGADLLEQLASTQRRVVRHDAVRL